MDDLISRQVAIDDIETVNPSMPLNVNWVKNWVKTLPSAQPRWIPVTERLPEIDMSHPHHEDYLVQYDSGSVDVASWSNVNRFWTDHVTEPHWNCVQFAKVIAWMPIPEPYKEG